MFDAMTTQSRFVPDLDCIDLHNERVSELVTILSQAIGLAEQKVKEFTWAARVHDVGKRFIPEDIRNKPGKLSLLELNKMQVHCVAGYQMLYRLGYDEVFLNTALYHHENWDGSGYPDGLREDSIPLEAQICSICDVYEALRATRCYKVSKTHKEAVKIILALFGSKFNPKLRPFFVKALPDFEKLESILLANSQAQLSI